MTTTKKEAKEAKEVKEEVKGLAYIQANLNAPKSQYNNFGKYAYRSCEDILQAVKPLLAETNSTLSISDDVVLIGDRYYVKATASLRLEEEMITVSAFARESETKKGMDAAQITGSVSSYARKYALNGLFAIDDNKDPDSQKKPAPVDPSTTADQIMIRLSEVNAMPELVNVWKKYSSSVKGLPAEYQTMVLDCKEQMKKKFTEEKAAEEGK